MRSAIASSGCRNVRGNCGCHGLALTRVAVKTLVASDMFIAHPTVPNFGSHPQGSFLQAWALPHGRPCTQLLPWQTLYHGGHCRRSARCDSHSLRVESSCNSRLHCSPPQECCVIIAQYVPDNVRKGHLFSTNVVDLLLQEEAKMAVQKSGFSVQVSLKSPLAGTRWAEVALQARPSAVGIVLPGSALAWQRARAAERVAGPLAAVARVWALARQLARDVAAWPALQYPLQPWMLLSSEPGADSEVVVTLDFVDNDHLWGHICVRVTQGLVCFSRRPPMDPLEVKVHLEWERARDVLAAQHRTCADLLSHLEGRHFSAYALLLDGRNRRIIRAPSAWHVAPWRLFGYPGHFRSSRCLNVAWESHMKFSFESWQGLAWPGDDFPTLTAVLGRALSNEEARQVLAAHGPAGQRCRTLPGERQLARQVAGLLKGEGVSEGAVLAVLKALRESVPRELHKSGEVEVPGLLRFRLASVLGPRRTKRRKIICTAVELGV